MIDPFSSEIDKQHLYNIRTGKAASKETSTFLLNVKKTGNNLREKFIGEVNGSPSRFEEPIKRCKVSTFTNEALTFKKKKTGENKVIEVKTERNLFGRLLCLALEREVDIAEVLKYPLRWSCTLNHEIKH